MIYIAIGGNLPFAGQPVLTTLNQALDTLPAYGISIEKRSPFYHSQPVPVSDQPWFFNAVVSCHADHAPHKLLTILHDVEKKFGRDRASESSARNLPRTLDLDLIDVHQKKIHDDDLILPHPRLASRAFVLLPLSDIAPSWTHPVTGEGVAALIAKLPASDLAVIKKL